MMNGKIDMRDQKNARKLWTGFLNPVNRYFPDAAAFLFPDYFIFSTFKTK
jgi:hypothetical protein